MLLNKSRFQHKQHSHSGRNSSPESFSIHWPMGFRCVQELRGKRHPYPLSLFSGAGTRTGVSAHHHESPVTEASDWFPHSRSRPHPSRPPPATHPRAVQKPLTSPGHQERAGQWLLPQWQAGSSKSSAWHRRHSMFQTFQIPQDVAVQRR